MTASLPPDLTDVKTLQRLCRQYHVLPDPDAGQHFLVNRAALEATVAAAELSRADTVLEVGPGFGTLTVELAKRARRVIAVELDPKLYAAAKEMLQPYPNVELIHGNFLKLPMTTHSLLTTHYKLVSNLPYGITGRFFRRVLGSERRPQRVVVAVQQEVAERVTAKPGDLSVLGVMCQLYALPVIIASVPRENFWPPPEVDSAVVALAVRTPVELSAMLHGVHNPVYPPCPASAAALTLMGGNEISPEAVMRLVKVGFAARRKTLANNLSSLARTPWSKPQFRAVVGEALPGVGIGAQARAQELSIPQWITLAKKLKNYLN